MTSQNLNNLKSKAEALKASNQFCEPLDLGSTNLMMNTQQNAISGLNLTYSPSQFTTLASKMSSSELIIDENH